LTRKVTETTTIIASKTPAQRGDIKSESGGRNHLGMKGRLRRNRQKGAILAPTSKKAKAGQWNPHWSVMRQADDAIKLLEAELGIAPVRRSKATKAERKQRKSRPSDAFIRPAGGQ